MSAAPASGNDYCLWLSKIVDPKNTVMMEALKRMSQEPSKRDTRTYASDWCVLSTFLHENKNEPMWAPVEMQFSIPGSVCKSDVYWFEVVSSCLALAEQTIASVIDRMDLEKFTRQLNAGYASHALSLTSDVRMELMGMSRYTISVCRHSLWAAEEYAVLRNRCILALRRIREIYNSLRVVVTYLFGLFHIWHNDTEELKAWNAFATCNVLAEQNTIILPVVTLLQSIKVLGYYPFVQNYLRRGDRSLAIGFLKALQFRTIPNVDDDVVAALEQNAMKGNVVAVPDPASPLLRITTAADPNAQLIGTIRSWRDEDFRRR